jgi:hypothetical protein
MGGNILTERIITKSEEYEIGKATIQARRMLFEPNRNDEDRLNNAVLYLNVAIGLCDKVRKRWEG